MPSLFPPALHHSSNRTNIAARVCIVYAVVSTAWILLSDRLLFTLVAELGDMALLSMTKGIAFVLTTTAIIYVLVSRALRKVEQKEEQYRSLIENSPDAILLSKRDNRIILANRRAVALFGHERIEDLVGKSILDLVAPGDEERVKAAFAMLRQTGSQQTFEHGMLRNGGSVFPVEQIVSLARLGEVQSSELMSVVRDITARKNAEDTLRESEQRYRYVFHRSPIGIFHYNTDWCITDCNARFVDILQSSRDRLIGFDMRNIKDRSVAPALGKALEGVEGSYEGLYSATTGPARIWVSMRTAPLFDEQMRVKGAVAIVEDTSERRRAEEALQNAERHYREIFEHAGEGIYQSTPDGRFIAANLMLAKMLEYESADELMSNITDIERQLYVDQKERSSLREALEEHGSVRGFVSQLRRKDGTTIWVSENARIVWDGAPQVPYFEGALQDITEQKKAEEALLESEERYRSLVELSPDAIGVHSEGKLVYANAAAAQMLGAKSPAELLGKPILEFVHPDYHEVVKQRVQSAGIEGRVAPLNEEKFIRLDGVVIDVEVVAIPFTYRSKPAVQVVIRDISARNQAEREIRLLAQTVASTKDCVSITDLDDRTLFVNDAFVETYGYTREDLIGKSISVIRSPATPAGIASQIRPATLAGGWYGEIVNRRKDGSDFPVDLWTSVVKNELDEPVAMVGVARDITERKRAEESMQKLLRAIEQSDEVMFMTERDGTITYVNPAFERVYGFKREEVIGKTPRILKGGTLSEEVYRDFWTLLLSGKSVRGDITNRTKSGRAIIVESSVSPVHDTEGNVTGFIAVQDDITDRKRAEEEKKTLESQLLQSQKIESLGTLAGGIAHDFNNILGIILGHATLLDSEFVDQNRFLKSREAIIAAVQRGASLVQQILTFARRTEVSFEPIDLNGTITELVRMLAETFPRTITFSMQLAPTIPLISADRTQLHQMLLNLCVNARDAMADGGTLSFATGRVKGEYVRTRFPEAVHDNFTWVRVSDDGTGMDEATMRRIFEPFFTTKPIGKGTGLGLAVVDGIMKSHHGFVDVKSELGRGTSFCLYFPVVHRGADLDTSDEGTQREVEGGRETLLFVEDEDELREVVRILLESKGYKVLAARDGEEAVRLYQEHQNQISLVITDMGLPKVGGEEVCSRLRSINTNVKVIIASGFLEPEVKANLQSVGVLGFMQKPYAPADILKKVRAALDVA